MRLNTALFALLAIALLPACGKKDEAGSGASKTDVKKQDPDLPKTVAGGCNYSDTGICTFNKESDPAMCKAMSGIFAEGECPKQGAVPGSCLCKSEYNTEVKTYYTTSAAAYTVETAKLHCTNQQCEWQAQ